MADLSYLLPYATNDIVPADTDPGTDYYLLGDLPDGRVFLLPKVSTTQRNEIQASKLPGFLVYNTTISNIEQYLGSKIWCLLTPITSSGGGTGGSTGTVLYTNLNPVPVTIGGISSGSTFTDATMTQMWDGLLYPYQTPTFSNFYIVGQPSNLEIGDSSLANPVFNWIFTNPSSVSDNTINISDLTTSESLVINHSKTPTASISHASITKTSVGSEVYRISATNTQNVVFSRQFTINWLTKIFYGESPVSSGMTETDIKSLRVGSLQGGFAGTYNFIAAASSYKYICYPQFMGTATNFVDPTTNFSVPFDSVYTVDVINSFGIRIKYNVHKTFNMIGGALTVAVS